MPRDANGNYTLPNGNPVVTDTLVSSNWANTTMNDLKAEMADSLSRSGNGNMLAALKVIDGLLTAPALSFTSEPSSGFYHAGTGDLRFAVQGEDVLRIVNGQVSVWNSTDSVWYPITSSKQAGGVIEVQTLAASQTVVPFTKNTAGAAIYLNTTSGDRGRLFIDDDYTYDSVANEITLLTTHPTGTKVAAVVNDETDVYASAEAASNSANAAAGSESGALASADAAGVSETNAALSETNSAASEVAAALSETNAGASEAASAISAAAALVSENNSATSESNASTSETNAASSETNAGVSETNAGASAAAALVSETNAFNTYDEFDDRYLGSKSSEPTLDNDGDPLLEGAMYWSSSLKKLRVYNGTVWEDTVFVPGSIDADLLGGVTPENYARTDIPETFNSVVEIGGSSVSGDQGGITALTKAPDSTLAGNVVRDTFEQVYRIYENGGTSRGVSLNLTECAGGAQSKIWHSGNDGSGSGLDADKLDGVEGANYARTDIQEIFTDGVVIGDSSGGEVLRIVDTGGIGSAANPFIGFDDSAGTRQGYVGFGGATNQTVTVSSDYGSVNLDPAAGFEATVDGSKIWHSGNDGAGSGLEADKLDGLEGSQFLRSDVADTTTGKLNIELNTSNPVYNTGQMELRTTNATDVSLGFHRSGYTACQLRHEDSGLILSGNGRTTAANFYAYGNIFAYSDIRYKENIEKISSPLEKVDQLNGYTFTRTNASEGEEDTRHTGVIAQEVQKVLPEAVSEDTSGMLTVAYGNMVGLLIEAIKDEKQKRVVVEAELDDMKERMLRLEALVESLATGE